MKPFELAPLPYAYDYLEPVIEDVYKRQGRCRNRIRLDRQRRWRL